MLSVFLRAFYKTLPLTFTGSCYNTENLSKSKGDNMTLFEFFLFNSLNL